MNFVTSTLEVTAITVKDTYHTRPLWWI